MLRKKSLLVLYATAVLSVSAAVSASYRKSQGRPPGANGMCHKRVPYDDALATNISNGIVKLADEDGAQLLGSERKDVGTWVTIIDCCDGYARDDITGGCQARCDDGCLGGTCTDRNVCVCKDGWEPRSGVCMPVCRVPCMENAYCFAPEYCSCEFGYQRIDGSCRPACLHDCMNGDCVAPRDCRCHPGFFLNDTQHCEPICEDGCPHGQCVAPEVCSCDENYVHPPYNRGSCVPSCPDACLRDNGECLTPDVCTCMQGFSSAPNGSCIPQCKDECINGRCEAPDRCSCSPGFTMDFETRKCVEDSKSIDRVQNAYRTAPTAENRDVDASRNQQIDSNDRGVPHGRARGTQGTDARGNREKIGRYHDDRSENRYNFYGSEQTEPPREVIGLEEQNLVQTSTSNSRRYGEDRTNGPFASPGSPSTETAGQFSDVRGGNVPYRIAGMDQRNPQEPYPVQNSTRATAAVRENDLRPNQNNGQTRLQGPFAPLEPWDHAQQPQNNQSPYQNRDPYKNARPYGQEKPDQIQSPLGAAGGQESDGRIQNPHQDLGSHGQRGSDQTQGTRRPIDGVDAYGRQPQNSYAPRDLDRSTTSRAPENNYNPQQPGLYGPRDVDRFSTSRTPENSHDARQANPYGRRDFGQPQDSRYSPSNPRDNQGGRPSPGNAYGQPLGTGKPDRASIDTTGGAKEVHDPQQSGPRTHQPQNPTAGAHQFIDLHNPANNYNLGLLEFGPTLQQTPAFGQFPVICEFPCLNGECVGPNVCACKPGYSMSPGFLNMCLPICNGGCFNGVCTAPNLCICNYGFIKEQGIKGSQRCFPAGY